jgi:hypothetical protein
MAFPAPVPQEKARAAFEYFSTMENNGHPAPQRATADHFNSPRQTVADWIKAGRKLAAESGELGYDPVLPGYAIKSVASKVDGAWVKQTKAPGDVFEMPEGQTLKEVSALVDSDNRTVLKWIKTRDGRNAVDLVAAIKDAFVDFEPARIPVAEPVADSDLLTLIPCNDWHIGMFSWGKENAENWDTAIGEAVIGKAITHTIARTPNAGTAIVLGGGDLLHTDNKTNTTAKSANVLDVDGRYPKVLKAGIRVMVRTVEAALEQYSRVIVRVLPGNHDEHAAIAITYALDAWFRNDPRVTVDTDPSLFFWHKFGDVLLGATHGHSVKIEQMAGIMAHRRAVEWGATRFRYVHGFHLHHSAKFATEGNGVISEVHQAPIPQDAYHFGRGYLSGRSVQAITYHRTFGEVGRVRTAILDAA